MSLPVDPRIVNLGRVAVGLNKRVEQLDARETKARADLDTKLSKSISDLPILTLSSRCDGLDRKTTAAESAIQALDRQVSAALDGFRLEANTRYNEIKTLRMAPPPVELVEPMVATIATRYLDAIPGVVETRLADLPRNVAELVRKQLAAAPQGFDFTSVEPFELSATYRRGQLVNVRGSTYVVLKQTTGVFPERGNVRGPGAVGSPVFALIASAGAAGINTGGGGNVSSIGALTIGRVPYVGAGGALVDSANLTFDGTTLTIAGAGSATNGVLQLPAGTTKNTGIVFGTDTFLHRLSSGQISLNGGGTFSFLNFHENGSFRGYIGTTSGAMQIDTVGATTLRLGTNATGRLTINGSTGAITIASLAGTGTRAVVVDANGVLSAP